jgi:hypothetical protein
MFFVVVACQFLQAKSMSFGIALSVFGSEMI